MAKKTAETMTDTEKKDAKKAAEAAARKKLAKDIDMPETITIQVGDSTLVGFLREFSTGSKGYFYNGKVVINDRKCQVGGNVVIVGSKE